MKMGMHKLLEVLQHRLFLHFAVAGAMSEPLESV
jgi:hypothetical protein